MRICTCCKEEKDESCFHKHTRSKSGYQKQCKNCRNSKIKEYYLENKLKHSISVKKWQENNKNRVKQKSKEYKIKNRDKILKQNRKNYSPEKRKIADQKIRNNPIKLQNRRKFKREYEQKRRKESITYRLKNQLRCRLCIALKGGPKLGKYAEYLGCSTDQLKIHLESKFLPGMSWDNWGKGEGKWNIDHIIPLSSFNLSIKEELFKACHYTNLQPLWEHDNLVKNNRII
jgi:hypothetical protein